MDMSLPERLHRRAQQAGIEFIHSHAGQINQPHKPIYRFGTTSAIKAFEYPKSISHLNSYYFETRQMFLLRSY
jgi:hypothetical protein